MRIEALKEYYRGKRVFLTGHTGFKGSWLSELLLLLGAEVFGYALEPPTEPSLFRILGLSDRMHSETGDIRDFAHLQRAFREAAPEIVLHLAAQPIVRTSYEFPRETYEANVMGTVNLLECVRLYRQEGRGKLCSFLNVTTDKVYENQDLEGHAFREEEKLDGFDPYSNSKSCSELVTHSYRNSFFRGNASGVGELPVSTARAGNVIGGGDFARDRIIPDCVRDTVDGRRIHVRNPYSTRPYQHVLEPLLVYLMIAMEQSRDSRLADYYNVGPDEQDAITTGELADRFVAAWGPEAGWQTEAEENAPHEAHYLKLDTGKLRRSFGWSPRWHVGEAVEETVKWYRAWNDGEDMTAFTREQISRFLTEPAGK